MRRSKSAPSAQRFTNARNLFRPRRHLLGPRACRATMRDRVATWREVARLRGA